MNALVLAVGVTSVAGLYSAAIAALKRDATITREDVLCLASIGGLVWSIARAFGAP